MTPRVTITALNLGVKGLRVTEAYFRLGRRVMDRKRWLEVRGW